MNPDPADMGAAASAGAEGKPADLPRRALGPTGLTVSLLGLGTVKLGRNTGVKYPEPFDLPTDEQAIDLLRAARDLGINLLDTAPAYGSSEQRLGTLLASGKIGQRKDWVLCTKAGESFDPVTGSSRHDFSPQAVERSIETSLLRLRADHVDVVLLHCSDDDAGDVDRAWAGLTRAKQRGLARAIGASTKTVPGGMRALEHGADVVMVTSSTINPSQRLVIERARRQQRGQGAGVLIKKALASGHAAGPEALQTLVHGEVGPLLSSIIIGTLNPRHLAANVRAIAGGCPDLRAGFPHPT